MNYIYGALLLHSAGKPIDEASLKNIIDATGEAANDAQIKSVVAALDGVNIEDAISKAAAAPVAVAAPAVGETKKEEEKEEDTEKKATEAAAGLGALFG